MAFDWTGYHRLARRLATDSPDEAALRSAISRAYYAVYHTARQRLRHDRVPVLRGGDMHERTWTAFRAHYVSPHAVIGVDGDRLRQLRAKADYVPEMRNLDSAARTALDLADHLLTRLRELPESSTEVLRPPS